ncbi:MAG TPA: ATP-dependent DNA helicase RecG, partial [Planctomycetes bacterium]|nr:ATP-dependent DNA helicase RecG [Planctomycetota bacterium]
IGSRRERLFSRLGVQTAGDLLLLMPREYRRYVFVPIGTLRAGETAAVSGMVKKISLHPMKRGGSFISAHVADASGSISVLWFNQPYVLDRIAEGGWFIIEGRVREGRNGKYLEPVAYEEVDEEEGGFLLGRAGAGIIRPVYPLVEGLSQKMVARSVSLAMERLLPKLDEHMPPEILKARALPDIRSAFALVHAPENADDAELGRKRLAFDELMLFSLAVLARKKKRQKVENRFRIMETALVRERIMKRIPFALTAAQERVIGEIKRDLAAPHYMNRLLQGDVGTGKTVVAFYAMLLTVAAGRQAAVLAPTEILAQQHYAVLSELLKGSKVRVECLTSAVRGERRRSALEAAASGEAGIVVGTHAILEKKVVFKSLALAVMDEQHRFGVMQRRRLREKSGGDIHTLLMTATPIPRTLALTLYGDLDLSLLDEYPPGRAQTDTRLVPAGRENEMWMFARKRAEKGERVYVVVPLIEESEKLDVAAAVTLHRELSSGVFADLPVGLVHGRVNSAEKEKTMARFRSGAVPIIVSTVVIEVGLDVPEATVMVVMNAERYGLSQLHQLRGRIGRGRKRSFLFLVPGAEDDTARQRLRVLTETRDGFKVAEEDFRLRGMGEFFGAKQHGRSEFVVADLTRDYDMLAEARETAERIIENDPGLKKSEHQGLRHRLLEVFGARLPLVDVG